MTQGSTAKEISKRLERARLELLRIRTLKEFHQGLLGDNYDVSYNAVRNYHMGERSAPGAYLSRIQEVYGIQAGWLMTGIGDPQPPLPQGHYRLGDAEDKERAFREAVRGWDGLPEWVQGIVKETARRLARDHCAGRVEGEGWSDEELQLIEQEEEIHAIHQIGEALRPPADFSLGWGPDEIGDERMALFTAGVCQALMHLIPTTVERLDFEARRERELDEKAARAPSNPPAGSPERAAVIAARKKRAKESHELNRRHRHLTPSEGDSNG